MKNPKQQNDKPTIGTGNWDMLGETEISKPELYNPQKELFEIA
jgi:hypothetical protein